MAQSGVVIATGNGSLLRVRQQNVARLILLEDIFANEVIEPVHAHHLAYFKIILKGGITEHEKRRTLEHYALSVAFQPIEEPHSSHIHPEGIHYLKVFLSPEWLERLRDSLDRPSREGFNVAANFAHGTLPWLGVRLYDEWQRMDTVSHLTIEGLVLEMVAEAIRCRKMSLERTPPRWLKAADDLLHAEFAAPLTLEYVAQAVGVHPVHLARTFRQQYHCTVGDYVRQLRIEAACQQIASSDLPLADIALAAGFADQSHFTKTFKRLVGVSPTTFRDCCSASSRIAKIDVTPQPER